jgi:hypothetical protein
VELDSGAETNQTPGMFWKRPSILGSFILIPILILTSSRATLGAALELGISVQQLIPTHMPEFSFSLPAVGPNILIPIGDDHLRVQGLFTAQSQFVFYLAEVGYTWTVTTPFFTGFAGLGAHYMHYSTADALYDFVGGNLGVGLTLAMSKNFHVLVEMKGYIQEKSMLTAGAGFCFVL